MASLADLYITVHPDTRGVARVVERSGRESGKRFGKSFTDVSKIAIGGALATVLESGARAIGRGIKGSIKAASDLNETINKSNVIFGQSAKEMEKWASTAATSLGQSKQEALDSAASFGDMFQQIGFARGASVKMSKGIVQLSADLGSFNNLPTADVQERIAAAFRGEYDSLQKVIPNINAARVQQVALAESGKKSVKELTAQEKAHAVLTIIQKDGKRAQGDFARTSDGLANQTKIAKAQVQNLSASIGKGLTPILEVFLKFVNEKVFPRLQEMADRFGKWLPGAILRTKNAIKGLIDILVRGDFTKAFHDAFHVEEDSPLVDRLLAIHDGMKKIRDYLKDTLLPKLQEFGAYARDELAPNLIKLRDAVTKEILPAWIDWYKFIFEQLQPILDQVFTQVKEKGPAAFGGLVSYITDTLVPGLMSIVTAAKGLLAVVIPIISEIVQTVIGKFEEMSPQIREIFTSISEIVGGAMFIIKEVIEAVTTIIRLIWEDWGTEIKDFIGLIFEGIINIIGGALKIIAGVIKLVVALIQMDWAGAWDAIKQIFAGVWQLIKGILQVALAGLWTGLKIWLDKVKFFWNASITWLKQKWHEFWTYTKMRAKEAMDGIRNAISTALTKIKEGFSAGVNAISRIWVRIQDAVKDPIKFVIETVLEKGILGAVREISKLVNFKAGEDIHVKLPANWGKPAPAIGSAGRLASGGVLPGYTPGRDVHEFTSPTGGRLMLSGGEGIARPEIVKAMGAKRWMEMNAAARRGEIGDAVGKLPRFASGGIAAAINYAHSIGIRSIGTYPGHHPSQALARDFMTSNRATGNRMADWLWANRKAIHLWYEIYWRRIRSQTRPSAGWQPYTRSNPHTDHVHGAWYPAGLGSLAGKLVGAGAGFSGIGGAPAIDISKYTKQIDDAIAKLKSIGGGDFGKMIAEVPKMLAEKVKAKITDLASQFMATSAGTAGGFTNVSGGSNRAIGHRMMLQKWAENQWPPLNSLWTRESGWRTTARNPSSGAYGIPQSLPASKMASAGSDWRTNPATQIKWGLGYIASRYGNPAGAWAHSQRTGWYDRGGFLPPGATMAINSTGRDELITPLPRGYKLTDQDDKLDKVIELLGQTRPLIGSVTWAASDRGTHDDMEELAFQLRRLDRGGAYK